MILPFSVDVALDRRPWGNWLLIVATVAAFLATTDEGFYDLEHPSVLMLDGFGPGVVGHVLVHGDPIHLMANVMFLWVFGNAVCARVGSIAFPLLYALFAVAAAMAHLVASERPAIGASGAVSGVVGMFVVFHPMDHVRLGVVDLGGRMREMRAWAVVLIWMLLDIMGLLSGMTGTAYAGHLGGMLAGFVIAVVLLKSGRVPEPAGATILDLYWRK